MEQIINALSADLSEVWDSLSWDATHHPLYLLMGAVGFYAIKDLLKEILGTDKVR